MPELSDGQLAPPVVMVLGTAWRSASVPARTGPSKTDRRSSAERRPACERLFDRSVETDKGGSGRDQVPTERVVVWGPETRVLEISGQGLISQWLYSLYPLISGLII